MSNNTQTLTLIEQFFIEIGKYGDISQIPKEVIDKYMEMEKYNMCQFASDYSSYELEQNKPAIKGAVVSMCPWTFYQNRRQ
jgi:hypothetical protein